jgi:hypothetical protein
MIPRAMLAVAYATGRASHARQVKRDDPDKKGYPGPPGWGLGVRLTTPPHKKYCYETSRGGQGPPRAVEPMMMMMTTISIISIGFFLQKLISVEILFILNVPNITTKFHIVAMFCNCLLTNSI